MLFSLLLYLHQQTVLLISYNVDPSNVRKQTGTFAQAFTEHEEQFKENIEKVQTWRDALREVTNVFGWYVQEIGRASCRERV